MDGAIAAAAAAAAPVTPDEWPYDCLSGVTTPPPRVPRPPDTPPLTPQSQRPLARQPLQSRSLNAPLRSIAAAVATHSGQSDHCACDPPLAAAPSAATQLLRPRAVRPSRDVNAFTIDNDFTAPLPATSLPPVTKRPLSPDPSAPRRPARVRPDVRPAEVLQHRTRGAKRKGESR
jgi:hypothetical protein